MEIHLDYKYPYGPDYESLCICRVPFTKADLFSEIEDTPDLLMKSCLKVWLTYQNDTPLFSYLNKAMGDRFEDVRAGIGLAGTIMNLFHGQDYVLNSSTESFIYACLRNYMIYHDILPDLTYASNVESKMGINRKEKTDEEVFPNGKREGEQNFHKKGDRWGYASALVIFEEEGSNNVYPVLATSDIHIDSITGDAQLYTLRFMDLNDPKVSQGIIHKYEETAYLYEDFRRDEIIHPNLCRLEKDKAKLCSFNDLQELFQRFDDFPKYKEDAERFSKDLFCSGNENEFIKLIGSDEEMSIKDLKKHLIGEEYETER